MTIQKTQQFFGKMAVVAMLLFAFWSNIRLITQNNQLNKQIELARLEVDKAEHRNKKLALLVSYYQSPSYQEAEARRRLGMKKPDETVLIIKGLPPASATSGALLTDPYQQPTAAPAPTKTNPQLWWEYLTSQS